MKIIQTIVLTPFLLHFLCLEKKIEKKLLSNTEQIMLYWALSFTTKGQSKAERYKSRKAGTASYPLQEIVFFHKIATLYILAGALFFAETNFNQAQIRNIAQEEMFCNFSPNSMTM